MKHLEEAFTGAWHMHERAGEVGTGPGDTQLAARSWLQLEHATPGGRETEDKVGRELRGISAATWGKARPR